MKRKPNHRKYPNILVTGTPGTGKTTICEMLVEEFEDFKLRFHDISDIAHKKDFIEERDEERDTYVLDEDKLCDYLEEQGLDGFKDDGGHIVEYHSSGFLAERYFDLVVVVRARIEEVAKRLKKRNYSDEKVKENIECEIMQVSLDEANDSYEKDIIRVITNDNIGQLQGSVNNIITFIKSYFNKNNQEKKE